MRRLRTFTPLIRAQARFYSNAEPELNTDVVNGTTVVRDVDTNKIMTTEQVAKVYFTLQMLTRI